MASSLFCSIDLFVRVVVLVSHNKHRKSNTEHPDWAWPRPALNCWTLARSCCTTTPGALLLRHNPWRALAAPQPLAALLLHHNPLAHATLPWRAPAAPQPPWHTHPPPAYTKHTDTHTNARPAATRLPQPRGGAAAVLPFRPRPVERLHLGAQRGVFSLYLVHGADPRLAHQQTRLGQSKRRARAEVAAIRLRRAQRWRARLRAQRWRARL